MFGLSRRERALKKATGALAEFYQVPHPGPRASLADLPMLAVDVETTGLSPRDNRLLSIGWVPIDGGTITLAGAGMWCFSNGTEHRWESRPPSTVSPMMQYAQACPPLRR